MPNEIMVVNAWMQRVAICRARVREAVVHAEVLSTAVLFYSGQ